MSCHERRLLTGVIAVATLLAACNHGPPPPLSPTLQSIELSPPSVVVAKGLGQRMQATGIYSNGASADLTATVNWSVSDTSVARIDTAAGQAPLVTALSVGTATVTASLNDLSASATLKVTDATLTAMTISPDQPSLALGTSVRLLALGTFTDGSSKDISSSVAWTSSDASVATVAADGSVASLSAGSITVTAALQGVTASVSLVVTPAALTSLAIQLPSASLPVGMRQAATAIGTFTDGTSQDLTQLAAWSSSDPAIVDVSTTGSGTQLHGGQVGQATLTATVNGITATASITVTPAQLLSLGIASNASSVPAGLTLQFSATGVYSDGSTQDLTQSVLWSSSDSTVASISNAAGSQGLATGMAQGTANIQASLSGVSATSSIQVSAAALQGIVVSFSSTSLPIGAQSVVSAVGGYSDGSRVDMTQEAQFSASDPTIVSVSTVGSSVVITAVAIGSASITASFGGISGSSTISVLPAALVSLTIGPATLSVPKGAQLQLTAQGTYTDRSVLDLTAQVSWSSSDPTLATVSNDPASPGLVTGVAQGTPMISATMGGQSMSATLTVTAPTLISIALSPASVSVAVGSTQQYLATGTFSDSSTADLTQAAFWTSSDPTVATVSNDPASPGLATAVAAGQCTITAGVNGINGVVSLTAQ